MCDGCHMQTSPPVDETWCSGRLLIWISVFSPTAVLRSLSFVCFVLDRYFLAACPDPKVRSRFANEVFLSQKCYHSFTGRKEIIATVNYAPYWDEHFLTLTCRINTGATLKAYFQPCFHLSHTCHVSEFSPVASVSQLLTSCLGRKINFFHQLDTLYQT